MKRFSILPDARVSCHQAQSIGSISEKMDSVPVMKRARTLAMKKRLNMPKCGGLEVKEWQVLRFYSASRSSIGRIKQLKSILDPLSLLMPVPLPLVTAYVAQGLETTRSMFL